MFRAKVTVATHSKRCMVNHVVPKQDAISVEYLASLPYGVFMRLKDMHAWRWPACGGHHHSSIHIDLCNRLRLEHRINKQYDIETCHTRARYAASSDKRFESCVVGKDLT